MKEKWRPIEGYEKYEVSNLGRVRSWQSDSDSPRILKNVVKSDGCSVVSLVPKKGVCITHKVHILVAKAFLDGYVKGLDVGHIDGDKSNIKASNLKWTTRAVSLQIIETGEIFRFAKELAKHLGVTERTVSIAVNGRDGKPPTYRVRNVKVRRINLI